MTLTPWIFQSTCLSLISITLSEFGLPLIWFPPTEKGVFDEARRPRLDFELLFSGGRRGRARLLQAGRARRLAGAGLPGRQGLSRAARRCRGFRRRLGAFGTRRVSRMAGCKAALRPGA